MLGRRRALQILAAAATAPSAAASAQPARAQRFGITVAPSSLDPHFQNASEEGYDPAIKPIPYDLTARGPC